MRNIKRKISLGFISAAIILSSTGCMTSPFQQEVPSTTWTTNAAGEKVAVTTHGETVLSSNEEVQKSLQDLYDVLLDKDFQAKMTGLAKKAETVDQKDKAAVAAFDKEANVLLKPIIEKIDQGDIPDKEFYEGIITTAIMATISGGNMSVDVPLSAVMVKDDKATVELSDVITTLGEEEIGSMTGGVKQQMEYIKVDGKWLVTGKTFFNPIITPTD